MITIPVPHGVGTPNVAECDGDYTMDTRRSALLWQVKLEECQILPCDLFYFPVKQTISFQHPLIDANNKSGSLEFSVGGNPDDFFPVTLSFNSTKSFSGIKVRVLSKMRLLLNCHIFRFSTVWRLMAGAQ